MLIFHYHKKKKKKNRTPLILLKSQSTIARLQTKIPLNTVHSINNEFVKKKKKIIQSHLIQSDIKTSILSKSPLIQHIQSHPIFDNYN